MQAYYLSAAHYLKCTIEFKGQTEIGFSAVDTAVQAAIKAKFGDNFLSHMISFSLVNSLAVYGTKYTRGLFVVTHFTSCLPSFSEIVQLCELDGKPYVIAKSFFLLYVERFHCYQLLESTQELACYALEELKDYYPLACYQLNGCWFIFPKHYVCDTDML
jgi:hypothetical protein